MHAGIWMRTVKIANWGLCGVVALLFLVMDHEVAAADTDSTPGSSTEESVSKKPPEQPATWTVMVYLNADNDLEDYAFGNFDQLADVGSTSKVNIVVQFARAGKVTTNPQWGGRAIRFHVTKKMDPLPKSSDPNVEDNLGRTDMGSGATLSSFVVWATTKYPADRYALVIWDHGQGWRGPEDAKAGGPGAGDKSEGGVVKAAPFRTISNDDLFGSKLYMRDVQDALEHTIASAPNLNGRKIDVIAFDACLMAMIETAYALRNSGQVMVGSQDLEPGPGWKYDTWLSKLVADPTTDAKALGALIVDGYKETYGGSGHGAKPWTTLSSIDLNAVDSLAGAVSDLAVAMKDNLDADLTNIRAARTACPEYAPDPFGDGSNYFYHIDLMRFADEVASRTQNNAIRERAKLVVQQARATILARYAGDDRTAFGSNGLCIYFPSTRTAYKGDVYAENGYEKANTDHPVEFVEKLAWSDFLQAYYGKVP
jgi:hypothetical protein